MKDVAGARLRILNGTLAVLKNKGIRFTMDDIAHELTMSKKTIYMVFPDKNTLLVTLVDHVFDDIKARQEVILADRNLSVVDRLKGILCVMPEEYQGIDIAQFFSMREKFPEVYARLSERLETNWEPTFALMDQGVAEGCIRPVDQRVFQIVYEAAAERFMQGDDLMKAHITYAEALADMVDMLVSGILV